ncbi:hypothetical protein LCGC14_1115710 [marine sediment metagenome]|uniref:Uncharacterized protein n=1 Tax=marine sediment metagenome TaxID=412755 RepID=A0A0F9PNF8_9ZZZZ
MDSEIVVQEWDNRKYLDFELLNSEMRLVISDSIGIHHCPDLDYFIVISPKHPDSEVFNTYEAALNFLLRDLT